MATLARVEEVEMVFRLILIWSTCIMFWTVYSQMTTFSVEKANSMDRSIGSFKIPAASLQIFLVGSTMLFTTLSEKVMVRYLRRLTGKAHGITSLQRISVGLVLSIIAMFAAALGDHFRYNCSKMGYNLTSGEERLDTAKEYGLAQKRTDAVPMSVYWLVPQFFLVGAGEAFAYVGQLEFFIKESLVTMKSMSTDLFMSTLSLGFYWSSLLVTLVNKVTKHGKNRGWLQSDSELTQNEGIEHKPGETRN